MPAKKLFLLDAMALIYRAHFAFVNNPIRNSKGINTSASYGFMNSLLEVMEKYKPTHLAVVFDPPGPTFRSDLDAQYKAQRQEMPEDITMNIPLVKRLLSAMCIPVMEVKGYEADDVIGTLAKKAVQADYEVFMMTPDKDFCQLVSKDIYILKPSRPQMPSEIWDTARVLKEWEVETVEQVIDILGLMGDASDNIPGIPGIGPKTAKKLISEYGSIENLIDNSGDLKGKVKERVEEHKQQALLSKELATIITDVPVELDEKDLEVCDPHEEELKNVLAELEFRTISRRIFGQKFDIKKVKTQESYQPDLFGEVQQPEMKDEAGPLKTVSDFDCEYCLIVKENELEDLAKKLHKEKSITFDTETAGLDPHRDRLVGFSFAIKRNEAWFIPVPADEEGCKKIVNFFKPILEDEKIEKVGQNIKFDLLVLKRYGIELKGPLFDTVLAHYLLEPDLRHNMDILAQTYLRYVTISIETLIGKRGKKQKTMADLDPEDIREYACEDADITLQLRSSFEPMLKESKVDKLFEDVETPLVYVLAEMEHEGVKVDTAALKEYSKELNKDLIELEGQIFELAGMEFNINSPKQMGEVLFDHMKLDPKAKRTGKTKQYSTGEDVLSKLAAQHKIASRILDYRSVQKLKSTYVDALPLLINPKTGRVHTSYNQAVASTGRLSSTNPNLQNIPIRTERGREIRKAFIPQDENFTILSADYSQIELRLMAAMSEDEGLLEAFRAGQDIHTSTASKIFSVPLQEVNSEMRRKAKMVNFGIIYGISAFGLAQRLEIPRHEAAEIIGQYFSKYPRIREFMDDKVQFARQHGYVETLLGRRRYVRDIMSRNQTIRGFAERNAINAPIQGTAADMIKIAMIRIQKEMQKRNMQSKMVMQVHDELVFDALKTETTELMELVKEQMQNALKLDVPIVVEAGSGINWLEAH